MSENIDREAIGNLVAHYRKKSGFTQKSLAEKIGIKAITVSQYESSKRIPRPDIMMRLISVLSIPDDEIYFYFNDAEKKYFSKNIEFANRLKNINETTLNDSIEIIVELYKMLTDQERCYIESIMKMFIESHEKQSE